MAIKFVELEESFQGNLKEQSGEVFQGGLEQVIIRTTDQTEVYKGDYIVTPKGEQQSLKTKGYRMGDDVTVEKIPYTTISNETGGETFIIGDM